MSCLRSTTAHRCWLLATCLCADAHALVEVDSLWLTPQCHVYHFNRANTYNEDPDCLRFDIGIDRWRRLDYGFNFSQFKNSQDKSTKIFGLYVEREWPMRQLFNYGIGFTSGYVHGGYDMYAVGLPYGFARIGAVRLDIGMVPAFIPNVEGSVQFGVRFDVLNWRG